MSFVLESTTIVNVFRHEYRELHFSPRLTAVTGPNGSGKSTAIICMAGCLTNRWPGFSGNRSQMVRQLAAPGSESYIRVTGTKNGARGVLTRHMASSKRTLEWGGKTLTRDTEIAEVVTSWLGLPADLAHDYLFVDQHRLFAFLDDIPSVRLDALNRLFHLDQAEKVCEWARKRLSVLAVPAVADLAPVRDRLRDARGRLTELDTTLSGLDVRDEDAVDRAKLVLEQFATQEQLRRSAIAFEARITAASDDVRLAELGLKEVEEELARSGDCNGREEIARDLETYTRRRVISSQTDVDARELERLGDLFDAVPDVPVPEWSPDDVDSLRDVENERRGLTSVLTISASGAGSCPTCGASASDVRSRVGTAEERVLVLDPLLAGLVTRRRQHLEASTFFDKRQYLLGQIDVVARRIVAVELAAPSSPARPEDELRRELALLDAHRDRVLDLGSQRARLVRTADTARGRLEALRSSLVQAERVTDDDQVTQSDRDSASQYLEAANRLEADRGRYQAQRDVLASEVEWLTGEVTRGEAESTGAIRLRAWRSELETLRDVFRRDALPARAAQAHLESLEDDLNVNLEALGVDFRSRVEEGLSFRCLFPDGRDVMAEWLSGGEKVIFALAWRLAVNARFASDVGLLVLDEPTAGLDSERLASFHLALKRARVLSEGTGLQLVVVTHEKSSLPLFDEVIELT